MFKRKTATMVAELCVLVVGVMCALPALSQTAEVKEKPPMYSYVSFWTVPRTQWAEFEKSNAADESILQKALASGALVAYGNDRNLVHEAEGPTHDDWWASTSLAGLLNVLDQFYKAGTASSPAMVSATKHWDGIYVSRFYNWRAGSYKNAYTHGASYKLKPDAPDEAVEMLSKSVLVPFFEKLLADGTIFEYEVDTEAVHTMSPGTFLVFYLSQNAEGLDKVNSALQAMLKTNQLVGPAFGSMVDFKDHRDYIVRTNAVYK